MGKIAAVVGLLLFAGIDTSLPAQGPGRERAPRRAPRARGMAPPPPERPARPASPLSKLFRNFLGSDGHNALEPESSTGHRGPRDAIDGRIPHNITQGKHLEQAEQFLAAGHWDQALERLEILLANSEHATVRTSDGRAGLLAWEANRLLGRLPSSSLQSYRLRHEAEARRMFQEGQQARNWDEIIDVATRFFFTETGQTAANAVGNFHFDRGEFGLASLWYTRLLESSPPLSQDPKWRLKVAFALRESGNRAASDELLGRMRTGGAQEIDVGGDAVKPETWLNRFSDRDFGTVPVLSEWLQFLGSPSRTGTAVGGDPLLLPRWSHPTTQNKVVLDQIETLAQDLADSGRAPIPVAFPLMVNDRVAFRTLRGVHVVDAASGRLLWESRSEVSEESLTANYRTSYDYEDRFNFRRGRLSPWNSEYSGGDGADGHPLTGLLYRNANFGLLASDGDRLFVVEDDALIMHGMGGTGYQVVGGEESYRRAVSGNRLTAYDLATGRELWALGGPKNGEPFDLPLAGQFFFGVPLVEGGDLFAVAERDLDVSLYCIDPVKGKVRWSQLLAHSDGKIETDLGRRWWTAQVAYSNGILICPTTVGWLVGIDRVDHSVLWMHRYSPPRPGIERRDREQAEAVVPPAEINAQWCASAPIIVGNRVLYTPTDDPQPSVVCLDVSSGAPRWRYPKGEEQLYLAGVDDDRVVLVGKSSVTALSIDTGSVRWTASIEEGQGPPSGRGLIAGGRFYLPLRNGGLWVLDLAAGKILERLQVTRGSKPLGNLAMYHGLVLSLNAFGLTSYEQRDAIERQIAARQASDANDEWASLKKAQIALLRSEPGRALAALDRVTDPTRDPSLAGPIRSALFDALISSVRQDYSHGDAALERLTKVAQSGEEQLLVDRLQVEQAIAKGNFAAAFTVLQRLALGPERGDAPLTIVRPDNAAVTVDFDRWIAGQLADTWQKLSPRDRVHFDLMLRGEADRVMQFERSRQRRFVELYGFHAASQLVVDRLVDEYSAAGDLASAERLLLRNARSTDATRAASALLRLARLLDQFGLPDDADAQYLELARDYADIVIGGVSIGERIAARREAGLFSSCPSPAAGWGNADVKVYRFGTNLMPPHVEELPLEHATAPFFRDHRLAVDEGRQRLEIVGAQDDAQHWLLPLRSASRTRQGEYTVGIAAGHQLVVLHRDVLHVVAPVEKRVLWTRTLDVPNGGGGEYRAPHPVTPHPLRSGNQFAAMHSLLSRATQDGMLAAANSEYICLYGRREFIVLDAQTGDLRWKCVNIPQHATVFGTEGVVYLVPPERSAAVAFRASDGKRLAVERLGDKLIATVAVTPRGLVSVDTSSTGLLGLQAPRTLVKLFDPISNGEFWSVEYPAGSLLGQLDDLHLLCVSARGRIERLNFVNGEITRFRDSFPHASLRSREELYALADRDRVFLLAHQRRRTMQYPEGFRSITAGGTIVAFDSNEGKLLWTNDDLAKKEGAAQNLVLDFVRDSPVLIFASRGLVQNHEFGRWSLNLAVIDKQTGRTMLVATDPSASNLRTLELNLADRYIELRSYNQRMRLIAGNRNNASASRDTAK